MPIYIHLDEQCRASGWQLSPQSTEHPQLRLAASIEEAEAVQGKQWTGEHWVKGVASVDPVVTTTRFLRELLTLPVYGTIEVAETGLSAKFAAGTATAQDIQLLGMFRAAKAWINSASTINLTDPLVAQILDACIAIPYIGLTAEDKARILRNEGKLNV